MQKLLQYGGWVVCSEGLNGGLEALLFEFEELPLWNVATMDEPTWDPALIEVDLNSVELEAPPSTITEDALGLKGTDLAIHDPMATQKTSLPLSKSATHHPYLPC